MGGFVKRRDRPVPGSIPDVLQMFQAEVRFYREIAPHVGLRVPACYEAHDDPDGTLLVLENVSAWQAGADPVAVASLLRDHHRRWQGEATKRWPWLRPAGAGADLIGRSYDETWPMLASRRDLPGPVREVGERLVGRLSEAELAEAGSGSPTLIHGDASLANMRTSHDGTILFLDWEDVRAAAGAVDLAWLLVSSVEPDRWNNVIAAYGDVTDLVDVLPSAIGQGLFALADKVEDSEDAAGWVARLAAAAERLD